MGQMLLQSPRRSMNVRKTHTFYNADALAEKSRLGLSRPHLNCLDLTLCGVCCGLDLAYLV